jgi:protein TonB
MATETAVSPPATSLTTAPGGTVETGATKPQVAAVTRSLIASAAPAPGGTMVLPSRDADYLNNPAPAYPAISRRLGEQGKVVIRVLIDRDGKPQQGDVGQSSGYTRLDQAALRAVMSWRYVPGRRDGLVQDMWFDVPIHFTLE